MKRTKKLVAAVSDPFFWDPGLLIRVKPCLASPKQAKVFCHDLQLQIIESIPPKHL